MLVRNLGVVLLATPPCPACCWPRAQGCRWPPRPRACCPISVTPVHDMSRSRDLLPPAWPHLLLTASVGAKQVVQGDVHGAVVTVEVFVVEHVEVVATAGPLKQPVTLISLS